jgi:hypothetical protein
MRSMVPQGKGISLTTATQTWKWQRRYWSSYLHISNKLLLLLPCQCGPTIENVLLASSFSLLKGMFWRPCPRFLSQASANKFETCLKLFENPLTISDQFEMAMKRLWFKCLNKCNASSYHTIRIDCSSALDTVDTHISNDSTDVEDNAACIISPLIEGKPWGESSLHPKKFRTRRRNPVLYIRQIRAFVHL